MSERRAALQKWLEEAHGVVTDSLALNLEIKETMAKVTAELDEWNQLMADLVSLESRIGVALVHQS